MGFGQASGPPASPKMIRDLLALLQAAGHADFRDARGPMGFSQRQAAGRFTRDEAAALIGQLEGEGVNGGEPVDATALPPDPALSQLLRRLTDAELATELERRGWVVIGP